MSNTPSLRVFVVENNEDTLKYLRRYLEAIGHAVAEARTVAGALAEIPRAACDVLICDIGLADGTGWELMNQLRERGQAAPSFAIAMSGFGMNADRLKSESAGFRHHLLKPFAPEELDALLEEAGREVAGKAEQP